MRATVVSADNAENDDRDNIRTGGLETKTPDDRATRADAMQEFKFRNYDIELAQSIELTDSFRVRANSAVRMAHLDMFQQVTYRGGDFQTLFTPFQESVFDGAGIVLGGTMHWDMTNWLTVSFGGNGGAILGRMQTRTFVPDDEPGVPTDLTYDETRLVPVIETRAKITARRRFGRVLLEWGGGYEFASWFRASDQRVFTDSHIEAQNAHVIGDLTLDGFFGSFTLSR